MADALKAIPAPHLLKWSTRLLAAVGAAAMAFSGELDPLLLIVFLVLFLLGLWVEKIPRLLFWLGKIQPVLALLSFSLGVADFLYFSQSFLLAVAHFLLLIQGLRLLVLETPRENLGSILLSSMMILSAATLEIKWTFLLMLTLFLPVAIWTLIVSNLVYEGHEMARQAREAEEGDPAGDGDRFNVLKEQSPVWRRLIPSMRRSTFVSFFVAALCCMIVFIVFPRFNFRGFKGQFLQPVSKSGFSNQLDLKKGSRILTDDSIAMRVVIDPKEKDRWTGYLTGAVLDEFDGQVWRKRKEREFRILADGAGRVHVARGDYNPERILHQEIFLESMESPVLFAAPDPLWFETTRPFLMVGEDGAVRRPFGDSWRIQYKAVSLPSGVFDGTGKKGGPIAVQGRKISKPDPADSQWENPSPRVEDLARSVVREAQSPLEAALFLSRYLQTNFAYSLGAEAGRTENPVESFLFDVKKGHCEYFASSFCLMARSLNIPARIVTGFKTREWNERGGYFIARMKHAHSWAEVYTDEHGWVAFDPTPLSWTGEGEDSWGGRVSQLMDYLNLRWNRYILSYDHQRQLEIARNVYSQSRKISNRFGEWTSKGQEWSEWFRKRMSGVSVEKPDFSPKDIQGLVLFFAALGFGGAWFLIRKKKSVSPVWFYSGLVSLLGKSGVPKTEGETLKQYLEKISAKLGPAKEPAEKLVSLYDEARFGGKPLSEQETRRVNTLLDDVRRGMKKSSPRTGEARSGVDNK